MKQSTEKPPNWEELVSEFGVKWGEVVVTYGDTCYCHKPVTHDVFAHEQVHTRQQTNPSLWWKKYMFDVAFRIEQEAEAYREQMKWCRKNSKDRNFLFKCKDKMARDFSGPMYGRVISYDDALRLIG